MKFASRMLVAMVGLALAVGASAQITAPVLNPAGPNALFPKQNISGPTGAAQQVNYPYDGQCVLNPANTAYFPQLPACQSSNSLAVGYAPSFACPSGRTAGGWATCGLTDKFVELKPNAPPLPAGKFVNSVLNPPAYTPDTTTYPGADYYEIQLHESWGYNVLAKVVRPTPTTTAFPDPGTAFTVPDGKQWTGLKCSPVLPATTCTGGVAAGTPLFTPIWGVGSRKNFPLVSAAAVPSLGLPPGNHDAQAFVWGAANPSVTPPAWSNNNFFATWPSISIWATKDRPVVVKWINEFPNQHVYCPHPEAADWPCAIDRTFMGVKAKIDPALKGPNVPWEGVNQYGSPQQPDNSWVTHLHGADTPPSTDGFAEKWFGNLNTAPAYAGVAGNYVNPPFENPLNRVLSRPAGVNSALYTYPMMQDEATIWFHDHTLGKTHHNVLAGPAGFFPVRDNARHVPGPGGDLAWLNAFEATKDNLGAPAYDLFLAIQDRSFNDDGSINFSNGLAQAAPVGLIVPAGYSSVTSGANPRVHPVWVPEYFGDHVLVNGVLWPKKAVDAGWYRLRIVDGSDSRCWTIGFSTAVPLPGAKPSNDVPFFVFANDQGYLPAPVAAPGNQLTMCPGERYELLVDFTRFNGRNITMTNSAPAPFPAGITPFANKSPFLDMNVVMQFNVIGSGIAGAVPVVLNPAAIVMAFNQTGLRPAPAGTTVRQVYLNEKVDGVTLAPLGMQLNGVPFEYKVTETPINGSTEIWQFVNLTVDAHPMHPHLVKHLILSRQSFNVGQYKAMLCGSSTCQPGPSPGNEMQAVPDVTPMLIGAVTPVTTLSVEGGYKDVTQAPPGMVTTIVARWVAGWEAKVSATPNAPGTAGGPLACPSPSPSSCDAATWTYEDVTSGPYVWHCHINSHEDSEMMRTSLVVP